MKTYRSHNCQRAHRSPATFARCVWKHAAWVTGYHHGAYASVSYCHRGGTVMLWATEQDAQAAVDTIDALACGGRCRRDHHVIGLGPFLPSAVATPAVRAA